MSKLAQNKEKKRQAILGAALEVFTTAGFVNAKMDKIAEKAQVTKQTVYRYFPSKDDLFKATLEKIGENEEFSFHQHLQRADNREALRLFAQDFVKAHLLPDHIATFRLLISEGAQAPEMMKTFHGVGPDATDRVLSEFFQQRLDIAEPMELIRMWTGMLLSLRAGVLIGMPAPSDEEADKYASEATDFLLAALEGQYRPTS